jgi:2-keto-3-deoxygluconate permease
VATPAALALVDPSIASLVPVATSQIAAAVVTTIILTPILTQFVAKRIKRNSAKRAKVKLKEKVSV